MTRSTLWRWLACLALISPFQFAASQTQYSRTVGNLPIRLFAQFDSDRVVNGTYFYDKYNTSIALTGRLTGKTLELYERSSNVNTATFRFTDFDVKHSKLSGEWVDARSEKRFTVELNTEFTVALGEQAEADPVDVIQSSSTKDHYFMAVVVKERGKFYPRVTSIKVLKKRTSEVLQALPVDADYRGHNSVFVGDYNFDNLEDFSVYERSFVGPDSTSIYFLRQRKTNQYIQSEISGSSLTFDAKAKLVYEQSQCCGGTQGVTATYKIVNNRMVLIQRRCYTHDPATGDMKLGVCR